jgi:hypothetical protein
MIGASQYVGWPASSTYSIGHLGLPAGGNLSSGTPFQPQIGAGGNCPEMSMVSWRDGSLNARSWAMKMIIEGLGHRDKRVLATNVSFTIPPPPLRKGCHQLTGWWMPTWRAVISANSTCLMPACETRAATTRAVISAPLRAARTSAAITLSRCLQRFLPFLEVVPARVGHPVSRCLAPFVVTSRRLLLTRCRARTRRARLSLARPRQRFSLHSSPFTRVPSRQRARITHGLAQAIARSCWPTSTATTHTVTFEGLRGAEIWSVVRGGAGRWQHPYSKVGSRDDQLNVPPLAVVLAFFNASRVRSLGDRFANEILERGRE